MRVLCTADVHIGRTSTKLHSSSKPSRFTCSSAWNSIVECAISRNVDCLVMAGDIIDRGNSRFEALGSLEKGLAILAEANIRVYAVSGNHDTLTLPQISDHLRIPNFRMLGTAKGWECVEDPSGLKIMGRSFSRADEVTNPIDDFPELSHDDVPLLGIFHSSLSSAADTYAPISIDELNRRSQVTWVVGHIHQGSTSVWHSSPNVIIPGSPQALNPRETGVHGVCIADFKNASIPEQEFIPISSIQYEHIDVSLNGIQEEMEIPGRIRDAIQPVRSEAFAGNPHLNMLSLRVTLSGRTSLFNSIRTVMADISREGSLDLGLDVQMERLTIETGPCMDLDLLAKAEDVPARLASLIQAIDSRSVTVEYAELMQLCLDYASKTYTKPAFAPIAFQKTGEQEDQIPNTEQVTDIVRSQAMALLSELISQRERN